ncbi:hypothetical protein [Alkaliphilus sp. B6464]|uniref:hypothetical protein n=1 Tax=Alkaliphilus sp. B6464 TaxID=2731219 RepID=UPI001BA7FB44|nr:hypothetical protein [Alkaliphilus sp. B6464]QUH21071.1 hypothetical protein HYG84_15085 [Alkaliphilus sp. B6464]
MYPVSQSFLEKIQENNNRVFDLIIQVQHSKGVLSLYHKDLVHDNLIYTESSQAGEEFTIGSTVASDISFSILNKEEYNDIQFMGATVTCNIGLLVKEGADAHFLQPSQPSKMLDFEEEWEYVPLGRFNIDSVNKLRNTIEIKAIDNMINLDKPYSLSNLSYPANLYKIYVNTCNVCDVLPGTISFPNMNHMVQSRPDGDLTFRDVIGYVGELAGCFVKCNRNGAIVLDWYKPSGVTLGPSNRFDFKASDDLVQIKGIMATIDDTTYLAGTEDYAIDLSENPLLQSGYETVLPNIFNNVKDTIFIPYTSGWQGNPALMAGDLITQIDRDGKVYNTLITKSTFKYRGKSTLEAKGLPEISKGYKGSTNRKIAQIKRVVEKEVRNKLTTLEEQMLISTDLIANMLGGYAIKTDEALYIADNKNLELAQKVWKWGIGGFGYSENGVNGPYTTAITADGSIVAELVSAGIVTANMIKTGMLQSEDGSTHINLDNGSFSFKNALQWINNQLLISQGVVTIDKDKIRVNHAGTNQYSEIRANGFVRQWQYGEAKYLNDIFVDMYIADDYYGSSPAPPVRITLPQSFRGRGSSTKIILSSVKWNIYPGSMVSSGTVASLTTTVELVLEEVDRNFNVSQPYVDIDCYIRESERVASTGSYKTNYYPVTFVMMAVGE